LSRRSRRAVAAETFLSPLFTLLPAFCAYLALQYPWRRVWMWALSTELAREVHT